MARRVLVTGSLGVVGVWVVRRFRDTPGIDLCMIDHGADDSLARDVVGELDVLPVDVGDGESVDGVVGRFQPDVVVHLAAIMDSQAEAEPLHALRVNAGGTANVLEAARRHDVARVVFASSRGAYGAFADRRGFPGYEPVTEDAATCHPVTLYGLTKLLSEGLGAAYQAQGGPEFAALRFATIYGPGKRARHGPMAYLSHLVEGAVLEGRSALAQGADESDDLVYVLDAAEAVCRVALHEEPLAHSLYNVSSGVAVRMRDVARIITEVSGGVVSIGPGRDPMGAGMLHYGVLDNHRLEADLDFRPAFDASSGLRDYARKVAEMPSLRRGLGT